MYLGRIVELGRPRRCSPTAAPVHPSAAVGGAGDRTGWSRSSPARRPTRPGSRPGAGSTRAAPRWPTGRLRPPRSTGPVAHPLAVLPATRPVTTWRLPPRAALAARTASRSRPGRRRRSMSDLETLLAVPDARGGGAPDAAGPRLHLRPRCWPGSCATSSPAPGPAWAGSRSCCRDGRHPACARLVGDVPVLLTRDGRASVRASPTPAATAATSCWPRANARRGTIGGVPVPRVDVRPRRLAQAAPGSPSRVFDAAPRTGWSTLPVEVWHGWVFVNASQRWATRRSCRSPTTWRAAVAGRTLRRRRTSRSPTGTPTGGGQLEGDRRELPRVLPLPAHPSRAVPGHPPTPATTTTCPARGSAARWSSATHGDPCRSRASPAGRRCPASRPTGWSTSHCCPNLLISAHPDYVMTHRLRRWARTRTRVECSWYLRAARTVGPDPTYAVEFWDLTNQQDWAACESVQRGLASAPLRPGPVRPQRGRRRRLRRDDPGRLRRRLTDAAPGTESRTSGRGFRGSLRPHLNHRGAGPRTPVVEV